MPPARELVSRAQPDFGKFVSGADYPEDVATAMLSPYEIPAGVAAAAGCEAVAISLDEEGR
jgi:hypothetical protein